MLNKLFQIFFLIVFCLNHNSAIAQKYIILDMKGYKKNYPTLWNDANLFFKKSTKIWIYNSDTTFCLPQVANLVFEINTDVISYIENLDTATNMNLLIFKKNRAIVEHVNSDYFNRIDSNYFVYYHYEEDSKKIKKTYINKYIPHRNGWVSYPKAKFFRKSKYKFLKKKKCVVTVSQSLRNV